MVEEEVCADNRKALNKSGVSAQGCAKLERLGVLEAKGRKSSASGPKGGQQKTRATGPDGESNATAFRVRNCLQRVSCQLVKEPLQLSIKIETRQLQFEECAFKGEGALQMNIGNTEFSLGAMVCVDNYIK